MNPLPAARSTLARRLLVIALLAGCGSTAPPEPDPGAHLAILFIGNSLTSTNNLPAMVAALAGSAGLERVRVARVTSGGFSLEDHWNAGIALDSIRRGGWDAVVLQQGPSTLPASREHLLEWSGRFDREIRAVGARTAIYMVWPPAGGDLDAVSQSYAAAAAAVDGILLPAGEAWRTVLRDNAQIPLYAADQFHPAPAGSYLSALVIFGRLAGRSTEGLSLVRPLVDLPPSQAAVLERAADRANRDHATP